MLITKIPVKLFCNHLFKKKEAESQSSYFAQALLNLTHNIVTI